MKPIRRGPFYTFNGVAIGKHGRSAPLVEDIGVALGRICRFAGAGEHFFPVLLHSFVVCDLLPNHAKIYGLLHDACECLISDIPSSMKLPAMKKLEHKLMLRLYRFHEIPLPSYDIRKLVDAADDRALEGEVHITGPFAFRKFTPCDSQAAILVEMYWKEYPPMDCINPMGQAVKQFVERYELYKNWGKS